MSQSDETDRYKPFENPLGRIKGFLTEPAEGFVDPYAIEEREAIQELERDEEIRIDYHAKRAKRIGVNSSEAIRN
jgi:hypothetical protein